MPWQHLPVVLGWPPAGGAGDEGPNDGVVQLVPASQEASPKEYPKDHPSSDRARKVTAWMFMKLALEAGR